MKVIIAGPRDFFDYPTILLAIRNFGFAIHEVVSGGANGVDALGEQYARDNGIPIKRFDADWRRFGKIAGPLRNEQMAKYANALIAIEADPPTPGTANMIDMAKAFGLRIHIEKVNFPYRVPARQIKSYSFPEKASRPK